MVKNSQIEGILRESGLRATKPRVLILSFLLRTPYPVSVEKVIKAIGGKNLDQATVYRTLESFREANIVTQVNLRHGHADYELKDPKRDHHHIICVSCNKIEDFRGCDYKDIVSRALRQSKDFTSVSDHSLELFGLCRTCAK